MRINSDYVVRAVKTGYAYREIPADKAPPAGAVTVTIPAAEVRAAMEAAAVDYERGGDRGMAARIRETVAAGSQGYAGRRCVVRAPLVQVDPDGWVVARLVSTRQYGSTPESGGDIWVRIKHIEETR